MNKRYNENDEERDQSRRLERAQSDKQKSREQGGPRSDAPQPEPPQRGRKGEANPDASRRAAKNK